MIAIKPSVFLFILIIVEIMLEPHHERDCPDSFSAAQNEQLYFSLFLYLVIQLRLIGIMVEPKSWS